MPVDYRQPIIIPGFKPDMANESYHFDPAIGSTDLKTFDVSVLQYLHKKAEGSEPSTAMLIGIAAHLAVLEPDKFKTDVVCSYTKTRAGKAWTGVVESNPKKTVLTTPEMEKVEKIAEAVRRSPVAAPLVSGGLAEMSLFWPIVFRAVDGEFVPVRFSEYRQAEDKSQFVKIMLKARPDYLPGQARVVDLKTAADVTPEGFGKAVFNFRYHWSAYLYSRILSAATQVEHNSFYWIAAQSAPPFEVNVYLATPEHFAIAEQELGPVLSSLAARIYSDDWTPPGEKEIRELPIPAWEARKLLNAGQPTNLIPY